MLLRPPAPLRSKYVCETYILYYKLLPKNGHQDPRPLCELRCVAKIYHMSMDGW